MNVPATIAGPVAPSPVAVAGQACPAGGPATDWLDVLSSKMQAGESAGPARPGSGTANPAATGKALPGFGRGSFPSPVLTQTELGAPPDFTPASAGIVIDGKPRSNPSTSSPAVVEHGSTKGQPLTRSRRSTLTDDPACAAELVAAFQFQPLPKPMTEVAMPAEGETVDPANEPSGEEPAASAQKSEIQLPNLDVPGPDRGNEHLFGLEKIARPSVPTQTVMPAGSGPATPTPPARSSEATTAAQQTPPSESQPLSKVQAMAMAMADPSLMAAPDLEKSVLPTPAEPVGDPAPADAIVGIKAPDASVEIRGTPGAQEESTMKSGREQSEIAGWFTRGFLTRQNSTGDGRRVQAAISTSWRPKHSASTELGDLPTLTGSTPVTAGAPQSLPADAVEVAATPVNLATHITEQAVHFKSSGLNSLQVVLKPDSHTEIHLEFVTRDGQTEAHARVAHGDLQQLGGSWTQLQDSLAQQGIRLLPLSSGGSFSAGAGAQGQSADRRPPPEMPGHAPATTKPGTPSNTVNTAADLTVRQLIKRLGLLDSWA